MNLSLMDLPTTNLIFPPIESSIKLVTLRQFGKFVHPRSAHQKHLKRNIQMKRNPLLLKKNLRKKHTIGNKKLKKYSNKSKEKIFQLNKLSKRINDPCIYENYQF